MVKRIQITLDDEDFNKVTALKEMLSSESEYDLSYEKFLLHLVNNYGK